MVVLKLMEGDADGEANRGAEPEVGEARELVGAIFPIVGGDGAYAVRNRDGTALYLVNPANGTCPCPDYQRRGSKLGLPYKHVLAVQLA